MLFIASLFFSKRKKAFCVILIIHFYDTVDLLCMAVFIIAFVSINDRYMGATTKKVINLIRMVPAISVNTASLCVIRRKLKII